MKIFFLLAFILTVSPIKSFACVIPASQEDIHSKSSTIFSGKISSISCDNGLKKVEYKVYKIWKGEITDRKAVYGEDCSANTKFSFDKNKEYLVYGKLDETMQHLRFFSFSDCGGYTKLVRSNLSEWLREQIINLRTGMPVNWSLSKKHGVQREIELLGDPIHLGHKEFL